MARLNTFGLAKQLLELAAENKIDADLLALIDQNAAGARAAGQVLSLFFGTVQ